MSASVKFHFFCAPLSLALQIVQCGFARRGFSPARSAVNFLSRAPISAEISNEENCIRFEKKLKSGYE